MLGARTRKFFDARSNAPSEANQVGLDRRIGRAGISAVVYSVGGW